MAPGQTDRVTRLAESRSVAPVRGAASRSLARSWSMLQHATRGLTRAGVFAAHPAAFLVVLGYIIAWLAWTPETFDWHGVATVATWLMTLFIQRAEHRDTQAIHAKLDELLRAEGQARSELTRLDDEEPEVIERHRAAERR